MSRNIYDVAARKLSARSMSVAELRKFLEQKEFGKEEIDSVIAEFIEFGYLNDSRYATEYIGYAMSKNKGKRRIFQELRQKGIEGDILEFAYEDYLEEHPAADSEKERAKAEAEKIMRIADLTWDDPVPEKIRGRIARKLNSFGYSSSLIYEILGEMKR